MCEALCPQNLNSRQTRQVLEVIKQTKMNETQAFRCGNGQSSRPNSPSTGEVSASGFRRRLQQTHSRKYRRAGLSPPWAIFVSWVRGGPENGRPTNPSMALSGQGPGDGLHKCSNRSRCKGYRWSPPIHPEALAHLSPASLDPSPLLN